MLLNILLGILIVDAAALTGVILLQRSEGGALGMGGGGGAFLSVRGAGDLLTRTTWILAGVALLICVVITLLTNHQKAANSITERLNANGVSLSSAPLSSQQQQGPASGAPGAPPLPGSAPPLPGTVAPAAPASALPTEAPRPVVRQPQRQAAPVRLPSSVNTGLPAQGQPAAGPRPRLDLGAAAPAPASSSTPQQ